MPTGGTYALYFRGSGRNDSMNSFFWEIDGGDPTSQRVTAGMVWAWTSPITLPLSAGSHTLVVRMRESGTRIDRVFLSSSGTPPP